MNKNWKQGGEQLWILNDGGRAPPHHHHQYKILVENKCNAGWERTFSWVSLCIYDPGVTFVGLELELEQEEQGVDSLPERNLDVSWSFGTTTRGALVHINRTDALNLWQETDPSFHVILDS